MKEKIKTKEMKINCLIQASLGCLPIPDFSLSQDVNKIFRSGQRITRCLLEILWMKDSYNGLLNAVYLYKCFRAKIWENSKYVTKQLDGIGQFLSNALVNSGITTFEMFERTNPREIEMITNRHPPFGNQLKSTVAGLPKYKLTVEQNPICGKPYAEIEIHLTILNGDQVKETSLLPDTHTCALIIANADNQVIYKRKIMDRYLLKENGFSKLFHVNKANNGGEIYINLISFDWVGIDIVASFKPMFLKDETNREKLNSSSNGSVCSQKSGKLIQASVNTSCQHRCHNKKECAHQCCKVGFKNAGISQKRKQISQKNSVTPRSQPPKIKMSTGQNSLHYYMDGLKEKMRNITDTPTVKRLKTPNETQKVIDLKQFAFCPKPKISADAVDLTTPPTITAVTPLVRSESNDNRKLGLPTTPNGWNNLDIYHKTREKLAYEPDVNHNGQTEKTFNQFDNRQEHIPPSSPREIPFFNGSPNEELYGEFSLELPTLAQPFNKANDLLPSELNMFCKSEDSSQRQPTPQPQQQHKYGQVVAWLSQDSPRHPFQKNSNSQHDFGRTTSETLTNGFKVGQSERMKDLIFAPNQGIFCSEQELQNRVVQEEERSAQADNDRSFHSIFDGIF